MAGTRTHVHVALANVVRNVCGRKEHNRHWRALARGNVETILSYEIKASPLKELDNTFKQAALFRHSQKNGVAFCCFGGLKSYKKKRLPGWSIKNFCFNIE